MIAQFIHRLTTKIERLGYTRTCARFFAGFFYVEMVIVATLMGMLRVMQVMELNPVTGRSTGPCGHCPARCCPALLPIHS
jgi:hypothetical protein